MENGNGHRRMNFYHKKSSRMGRSSSMERPGKFTSSLPKEELIEGNYIDKKYYNFITTIKKSIENFLDIQSLNKNKCDLEQQLSKYEKIMKNMNKKINSEETGKSYEINKNFYNVDDFSDIAKIQNKLMIINDKLNGLYENKVNIKKEIDKF